MMMSTQSNNICPLCSRVNLAAEWMCPECGARLPNYGKAAAPASSAASASPVGPATRTAQASAQASTTAQTSVTAPADSYAPPGLSHISPAGHPAPAADVRIRAVGGGLAIIVLGGGLILFTLSTAHSTGRFFPAILVAGPAMVFMGIDFLIMAATGEAIPETADGYGARTKVMLGLGTAVGFALYFLLKQGLI